MVPAGANGGQFGEGAAAADDELVGRVDRVVGEGHDAAADAVGRGEDGPVQNSLAQVGRGHVRFGEEGEQVPKVVRSTQDTALLGLPYDGHRIDGRVAAHQSGQALPETGVQGQGEVLGGQPAHLLHLGRAHRACGQQQPLLLGGFVAVMQEGRRGFRGTGQRSGVRWESGGDVVRDGCEGVGLGQCGRHALRKRGVPCRVYEVCGGRAQVAAGVF